MNADPDLHQIKKMCNMKGKSEFNQQISDFIVRDPDLHWLNFVDHITSLTKYV